MQIVYALTNFPSFNRAWVKIGMTTRQPERRAAELSRTSVPFPFKLEMAFSVDDARAAESLLHRRFRPRITPHREFFDVDLAEVRAAMESLGGLDVTEQVLMDPSLIPDEPLEWSQQEKSTKPLDESEIVVTNSAEGAPQGMRRKAGRFFLMGLRKGDMIRSKEFPAKTAMIQTNRKVLFDGPLQSLGAATRSLYEANPGGSGMSVSTAEVNAFKLWTYASETLWEIYDRTYDHEAYRGAV